MSSTVALGLVWYLAFLFSTTLHEASHAWAALRMGDPTAYHGGQVSLNPIPHIRRELFGMVIAPILVYALSGWMVGWASAPYDPAWADRHPRRAGLMALAGPGANLLLVVVSGLVIRLGIGAGAFASQPGRTIESIVLTPAGDTSVLTTFVSVVFALNLILLTFNLLPLPPLDGSGALPLLMSEGMAVRYRHALRHPAIALAGILVAWRFFGYLFQPILSAAVVLLFPGAGGG